MKIFKFNYTKKDGEKSERTVMALHSSDKWFDGIDLTKLSEEEIAELRKIQIDYEDRLKPFMKKAFRRFLRENTEIVQEETIKE